MCSSTRSPRVHRRRATVLVALGATLLGLARSAAAQCPANCPLPGPSSRPGAPPTIRSTSSAPALTFNEGTNSFFFGPALVDVAEYLDGTAATSNGPFETIIGSVIRIDPMSFAGGFPGPYSLTDAGLRITRGGVTFLAATLTDVLLFRTAPGSAFDSRLQATLVRDDALSGLGSRYLDEYRSVPNGFALTFDTNIFSASGDFTVTGTSVGVLDVSAIAAPEPATWVLVATGLAAAAVVRRRAYR